MAAMNRIVPGPGQESVWDYPRPPRLEPEKERIRIVFNNVTIADTNKALRLLETSHPPVYYIPPADIKMEYVKRASGSSYCEWKGNATYWTVDVNGKRAERIGWSYERPTPSFLALAHHIAFYCFPMDACYVGDEKAQPQPGNFYGGWVTSKVVGPFKGAPGTMGW
ncbi:hypothetical protein KP509_28G042300 [Ceratopteris richardii]|uniref:DUF427 domain-containing protein n=1 Tax=Ceratopteris richardii TaxID=49495 RepID=A0A8T2RD86_CERRI|nr:hypothetical protein KP509_28G042300 [Ceratopteris richardii]